MRLILLSLITSTLFGQADRVPYIGNFPGAKPTTVAAHLNAHFDVIADGGCVPDALGTDLTACVNMFVANVASRYGGGTIDFPLPVTGSVYNICGGVMVPNTRWHGLSGPYMLPTLVCRTGPILVAPTTHDSGGWSLDHFALLGNPYLPTSVGIKGETCSGCYVHDNVFTWFGGPAIQFVAHSGTLSSDGKLIRNEVTGSAQAPSAYTQLTAAVDNHTDPISLAVASSSGFAVGNYLTLASPNHVSFPFEIVQVTAIPDATHVTVSRSVEDPNAGWYTYSTSTGGSPGSFANIYPLTAHAVGSFLATRVSYFTSHTGSIDLGSGTVDWHVAESNINGNFCPNLPGCVIDTPTLDGGGVPWVAALNAVGGNLRSDSNFIAFSGVGLYTSDGLVKIVNDRYEFNQTWGAVFDGGSGGSVIGTHAFQNGQRSTATYDGYLIRSLGRSFSGNNCTGHGPPFQRDCIRVESANLTTLGNANTFTGTTAGAITGAFFNHVGTLTDYTPLVMALPTGASSPDPYRIQMVPIGANAPGVSIGLYTGAWVNTVGRTDTQGFVVANTGFDQPSFDGKVMVVQSGNEQLGICKTVGNKVIFGDAAHCPGGAVLLPHLSGGAISSVEVIDPGSGYETAPSVAIKINSGGGSGGVLTATLSGDGVASVAVTSRGSGYSDISLITMDGTMAGRAGPTLYTYTSTKCTAAGLFWDGRWCHYYTPLTLSSGAYLAGTYPFNHVSALMTGGSHQIVAANGGISFRNTYNPFKFGQNWYCTPKSDGATYNAFLCGNDHDVWMRVRSDLKTNAVSSVSFNFPISAPKITGPLSVNNLTNESGIQTLVAVRAALGITAAKGLLAANNLNDIASASISRTNLGLGTAATAALTSLLQAANNLSDMANAAAARSNISAVTRTSAITAPPASIVGTGSGTYSPSQITSLINAINGLIVSVNDLKSALNR